MTELSEALYRLNQYNLGVFNLTTNPYGLSGVGGMAANWRRHSKDMSTVGLAVTQATGSVGVAARYAFDAGTTDADPGAGACRLDNPSPASATYLYASTTDAGGVDVTALLEVMDDSTSTTVKAYLILRHLTDPAKWVILALTGAVTTATGYRKLPVSYVAGPGGFAVSDAVALGFVRVGDKGDTGSGTNASQLNGATDSTGTGANTIAKRDSGGGLNAASYWADSNDPSVNMREADAGVDGKRWRLAASAGKLYLRLISDDAVTSVDVLEITRSGVTPTAFDFKVSPSVAGATVMTAAGGQFTGRVAAKAAVALTDGATITPDFSAGNDFTVTLGGNRTLANPTNLTAGQSGSIVISQDATGGRTLAFGTYWKFPAGTVPTLTTTASRADRLDYFVLNSTTIHAQLTKDVR